MIPDESVHPMNETLETISKRHSVRTFARQDISDDDIQMLLEAANNAPSAHNQQPWRFIVTQGEKKQELAHLVTTKSYGFPKPASSLLRMAARSIISAPLVIALANTGELIEHGTHLFKVEKRMAYDFFRTMEIQSSAAAAQNLLLAATSLGLSTVWLGILFLIKDEVLQFFGEPKGEFMAVIPVGYAARPSKGPQKMPVEKKVRYLKD
jgi:nitroreductase